MKPHLSSSRAPYYGSGLTLLLAGLVAACSAPEPPSAEAPQGSQLPLAAATGAARTIVIRMTDSLTYAPEQVVIAVGDTIEWVNAGVVPHTITARPGSAMDPAHVVLPEGAEPFDSGLIEAGQTFRHVVQASGAYAYFCALHETAPMVGRFTVN